MYCDPEEYESPQMKSSLRPLTDKITGQNDVTWK